MSQIYVFVGWSDDPQDRNEMIDLLKYINENIKNINQMNVHVNIKMYRRSALTKDTVAQLKKRNITRFPTLLMESGAKYTTLNSIIQLFERNKEKFKTATIRRKQKSKADLFGTCEDPLTSEFYREMMNPNVKADEEDEERKSLNEQLRNAPARKITSSPLTVQRGPQCSESAGSPETPQAPRPENNVAPGKMPPSELVRSRFGDTVPLENIQDVDIKTIMSRLPPRRKGEQQKSEQELLSAMLDKCSGD